MGFPLDSENMRQTEPKGSVIMRIFKSPSLLIKRMASGSSTRARMASGSSIRARTGSRCSGVLGKTVASYRPQDKTSPFPYVKCGQLFSLIKYSRKRKN
jgi:hypothetical protein